MAFKSDVKTLVLSALYHGPKHGYLIAKYIREQSQQALNVGESAIYPVLQDLVEANLVTFTCQYQDGKPARKVYSLSYSGQAEFAAHISAWERFVKGVQGVVSGSNSTKESHSA